MRTASNLRVLLALCLCAPQGAVAQGVGSGVRSISLVAVKHEAVESLDAVRVLTRARTEFPGDTVELLMGVEVRREMPCSIRVAQRGGQGALVRVRDADGVERELRFGVAILVYRGHCAAAAPVHDVRLRVAAADLPGDVTPGELTLEYEVVGSATGEPQRWVTGVNVGPPRDR